jgi:2-polyprenyl-6-methoxyphenol hydroxylase-like FAD-dependent oxidoreductase
MAFNQQHATVLIAGAGPSGLMMAAQLLRQGVQPVIIDSKLGPTDQSKALAVQARSLEIYRQLGIVNNALHNGKEAAGMVVNQDGEEIASLSLLDTGKGKTPFPYIFLYPQSKNERLLLDNLTLNCCPVYWNTTLLSLTQTAQGAIAKLQTGAEVITLSCDWVVGADGARSTVRKQLQIPFNGDTYANEFFLADVVLDNKEFTATQMQLYWAKAGHLAFFPLPEANSYRVIGNLPAALTNKESLTLDEVLPHLNVATGIAINVQHTKWFTTYKQHHRMADKFTQGRCFLVGDAAHIHSPVGGQGMNTGLQDAYNLAWKLAGVINGQLNKKILKSYATERMPVAKKLLNTTDRLYKLIASTNVVTWYLKKWILPRLVHFTWKSEKLRGLFFERVSQIGISYRESNINLHLSQQHKIKAGDRLPYVKIFDEKRQLETDLHEWCSKPGFTLIVLAKLKEIDVFTLAKWITQKYNGTINLFYLPPSAKNAELFELFDIKEGHKKALIIRPDMHIGYINDVVDIDMMDNYLVNVVGMVSA